MTHHTRRPQQILSLALACAVAACSGGATKPAPSGPGEAASMRISAVTPAAGSTVVPTPVTIDGTGFVAGTRVRFDGIEALSVTHESDQRLVAVSPPHAPGPVDLELLAPDGSAQRTPAAFRYDDPPVLSFVDPGHLPVDGGTVILHGAHFAPGATVAFGAGASVGAPRWLAVDQLVAVAPAHAAGTVDVSVTNPDGQRSTLPGALAYDAPAPPPPPPPPAPPVLAGVAPASGPDAGGTAVTFTGTGFDPLATASFGGSPATVTAATPTSLSVVAPPHAAGTVDVSVANPDGQRSTLALAYAYVAPPPPAPRLVSLAPASGPAAGGTTVTLAGSAFAAGATVSFGGASATVLGLSATGATVAAPPHAAGAVDVVLANPDGQSSTLAGAYTYVAPPPPPPAIASVAPASGPTAGGTALTITGTGFAAGATVTVGGAPAAIASLTSTAISANAPAHVAGAADVVVRNPDGQASTVAAGFTYVAPPVVASVTPASGPVAGGNTVVIGGSGFTAGTTATIGGVPVTIGVRTAASLSAVAPAHAAGAVAVAVQNPDGQSSALAGAYTYVAPPPPALASVAPSSGPDAGGTVVTLTGTGFQAGAAVSFGGTAAAVGAVSATSITATAPAHLAGTVDVVVANPDGLSATLPGAYSYVPPPVLGGLSPVQGTTAGGDAVLLTGSGFQAGATVSFGGVAAVVGTVTSSSMAVATPAHAAGAVDVVVQNPDGRSSVRAAGFTYLAPPPPPPSGPGLVSIAPASGPDAGGTVVTLTGTGFQAGAAVSFGGTAAAVGAVSATSITATTPAHLAGTVDVVVANPGGLSATLPGAYTYVAPPPPPVLSAVIPASGPTAGGTAVALSGASFAPGAAVTFGGLPATVVSLSAAAIAVVAPAHAAGAVDVAVRNPDGQVALLPAAFQYLAPPAIGSVAPASGPTAGGTALTIGGTGFQAGATVTVGGAAAVVGAVSATSISATTPAHVAGAADVVVRNPDGQASTLAAGFTYVAPPPPPAPIAVSPATGPAAGGTAVTISGTGFQAGVAVSFGGAAALVSAATPTAISAVAPAHAAGAVGVVVTNPDGQSGTLAAAFSYVLPPPAIASVAPASGPTAGGTAVTISGSGFQAGASVTFGGLAAAALAVTPTSISASAPAHAAGTADVVVSNPDGQAATLAAGFTYVAPPPPPAIASVAPASGPTAGGTAVILAGSGFQAGASVTFGGVAATLGAVSATSISAAAPAHPAGTVDVAVRNPDGQAATLAAGYAYVAPPAVLAVLPAGGPSAGGTLVTISGTGFQAGASVTFGGTAALMGAVTATSVSATAPAHAAGPVDVVVRNPDGQAATLAAAYAYALPPPSLASASPASGPIAGGTAVILAGSGFQAGASVTFGGVAATLGAVSATSISAAAPAHAAGPVDVAVRNPDGQVATLASGFTYVAPPPPPALAAVSPVTGGTAGGTAVTLTGSGFQAGATVTFGGTGAAVGALSATSISATAPAHAAGPADVVVVNPDGQSSTLAAAYTYVAPPPPPSLVSVTPASGSTAGGTAVVLAGSGFAAGATVTVGGVAAAVAGVSATAISLTTPAHAAGPADVVVVNPDGQSSTLAGSFTYVAPPPPPALAALTPTGGSTAGGTAVTLSGTGFASGATVTFGGVLATVSGATATALAVVTPAHAAGPVDVTVLNPDGQSSTLAAAYAYAAPPAPPPALAAVSPVSGPVAGGTPLTLTGTGFAAGATVTVGGAAAAVSAVSATSISATAPPGAAGPANVVVVNPDGQSSALAGGFTYLAPPPPAPPPALASVSPISGSTLGGNSVTLSGAGFAAGAAITFGGVTAAVLSTSATAITAAAPAHAAGAVDVAVVNPDGQSSTLPAAYSYVAPTALPPLITSIAPTSGTTFGGTTVTITGKEFVNPVVSFGGAFATLVSVSATSLGVLAPPHTAGAVDVVVTNADGQSATAAAAFTYVAPPAGLPAPVISSVTPVSGPIAGGTLVTVAGANFVAGTTVSFGGAAGFLGTVTATSITVTTPPGAAGPVDVTVVNPDRQAATLAAGFTYTAPPPVVLALSIHGSPQAGGQQVVLAGTGLVNAVSVTFGGSLATGLTFDPATGSLAVVTPPSPLGPTADVFVPMVVTNADGQTATVPSFHYGPPPVATGFTPATAPRGAPVTITGSAFTADATGARAGLQVSFGGTVATIQSKTPTQIVVAVPKLNPGVYQVFVTNFDGQFTVSPGTFTAPGP